MKNKPPQDEPTIDSLVDWSVLNAMRAWRRQTDQQAEKKLRLLRRLRRQYGTGSLPKYTETQFEQSFNEQIFARVFDYETILSHDGQFPHHIEAKTRITGTRRVPDFVVGTFVANQYDIIAVAELKSPDFSLTEPQHGDGYDGLSPVQQAFRSVRSEQSCKWIIVCNYNEIRLYERVDLVNEKDDPPPPIVIARLLQIGARNDLARLCAHFDRRALLGSATGTNRTPRSELMAAMKGYHSAKPIGPKDNHVRAVFLFTPRMEEDFAIFRLERGLRKALEKNYSLLLGSNASRPQIQFDLEDAHVAATMATSSGDDICKMSMSGLGQFQISAVKALENGGFTSEWLVIVSKFFVAMVDDVYHGVFEATRPGRVSAELREVKEKRLDVIAPHQESDMSTTGKARTSDVQGVDFVYTPILDKHEPLIADIVSELAIYFRHETGSGVGINRDALIRALK